VHRQTVLSRAAQLLSTFAHWRLSTLPLFHPPARRLKVGARGKSPLHDSAMESITALPRLYRSRERGVIERVGRVDTIRSPCSLSAVRHGESECSIAHVGGGVCSPAPHATDEKEVQSRVMNQQSQTALALPFSAHTVHAVRSSPPPPPPPRCQNMAGRCIPELQAMIHKGQRAQCSKSVAVSSEIRP